MKAERVETQINKVRAMELELQMFEAERARARYSWRGEALEAELAESEETERKYEIKGGRSRVVNGGEAVGLFHPGILSG